MRMKSLNPFASLALISIFEVVSSTKTCNLTSDCKILETSVLYQEAKVGDTVTFQCIGVCNNNDNSWVNISWTSEKWIENMRLSGIRKMSIGDCNVLSLNLTIHVTSEKDFENSLKCRIQDEFTSTSSSEVKDAVLKRKKDPEISYWAGIIVAITLFSFTLFAAILMYVFNLELRLIYKDRFSSLNTNGKYDLFICYQSDEEGEFVAKFILPCLENILGYKCFIVDRNTACGEWLMDVIYCKIKQSRCFLLIVSEGIAQDTLCKFACERAVEEAKGPRGMKLICVKPPTPKRKKSRLDTELEENFAGIEPLNMICKLGRQIPKVDPKESTIKEKNRFWKKLCLQLPAKRNLAWLKLGRRDREIFI
ncbi:X-linked interleukin-1 receptor accessory protein-like 2 [Neocloeon triangulifer]|uniref:X-linked interleukin-1 receptor accessory protein-like 2 n=1 Tax=Neocloeon triangulifer TaxID=2078957 RepID=UPI00286EB7DC|nr:X-linked interleukin-1 receptor accessory protein-like 2 [Neocloeon triangulifer]